MAALTRTPQNTNYLQPTKYLVVFDRMPTIQYFCQTANIPGISMAYIKRETPLLDIHSPGDKIVFDDFRISFAIDEKAQSWQELYLWMRSIGSPEGFADRNRVSDLQNQFKQNAQKQYSDATLTLLTALNNPQLRVQFINMFPISVTDINFDTKESADTILTADAVFVYDYFKFLPT